MNITNEQPKFVSTSSATPYKGMAEGVACETKKRLMTEEVEKRIVTLDGGPRPNYYGGKDTNYEVFQVLEAWGLDKDFYLGNVIKYVARAGKKNANTYKEDLQKAIVYLQKRIDSLEK